MSTIVPEGGKCASRKHAAEVVDGGYFSRVFDQCK